MNQIKVTCNTCQFFMKTITHTMKHRIVHDKTPDLSLCSKIGFRILEKGNPPIECNYYKKKPSTEEN
jgi:hypothetical protein